MDTTTTTTKKPFSAFNVERAPPPMSGAGPDDFVVRTQSMSTERSILKELRDSLNPYAKLEGRIMVVQAFTALVATIALCAVAVGGIIKLREVRVDVQDMATETTELKVMTQAVDKEMGVLVTALEPVQILPPFEESLRNMSANTARMNKILCGSSMFQAHCPADLLPKGAFIPGVTTAQETAPDVIEVPSPLPPAPAPADVGEDGADPLATDTPDLIQAAAVNATDLNATDLNATAAVNGTQEAEKNDTAAVEGEPEEGGRKRLR